MTGAGDDADGAAAAALGPTVFLQPLGSAVLSAAAEAVTDRDDWLAAGERLRRRYPAELVAAAFAQLELRRAAAAGFPAAAEMLFTRDGLEQASPAGLAGHRARRFAGQRRVGDLCCGIGGDTMALAGRSGPVGVTVAVDRDPAAVVLARHNSAVVTGHGAVAGVRADIRHQAWRGLSAALVDPARRRAGRRLPAGVSDPPLSWCWELAGQVRYLAVKTAPGLLAAALPGGWEWQFVAVGRALREAVAWSPAWAESPRRATVFPPSGRGEPAELLGDGRRAVAGPLQPPGRWLLDPSPAVTRAGLVAELAEKVSGWQLDRAIAFLGLPEPVASPFGRLLEVEASLPWRLGPVAAELHRLGAGPLDVRRRGLAGDVEEIRRRLRGGGHRRMVVVMTRVAGAPWALLCSDPVAR